MGDFPLMTDSGTFIINGAERVIVSQIVRSPGIYYEVGRWTRAARACSPRTVIPYRGAWLEYETDVERRLLRPHRQEPQAARDQSSSARSGLGDRRRRFATLFGDDVEDHGHAREGPDAGRRRRRTAPTADEEALKEIYKKLRPGEPPIVDSRASRFSSTICSLTPRDTTSRPVGRYKFNKKLALGRRISGYDACARGRHARSRARCCSPSGQHAVARGRRSTHRKRRRLVEVYIYVVNEEDETKSGGARVHQQNGRRLRAAALHQRGSGGHESERVQLDVLLEVIAALRHGGQGRADAARGNARRDRADSRSTSRRTISSPRSTICSASSHGIGTDRTTSTTSATAACARSASCCRTSSASAFRAWTKSSRKE